MAKAGGDENNLYGYVPTQWICALFVALFSISTIGHVTEALYFRLWWLLPTVCLAGVGEIIGWIGRLLSSHSPGDLNPYLIQICCTIIAPTPLVAANFVILGRLIHHIGPHYSRLSPGWYTAVFCSADIVALVVQAVGGASASEAVENDKNPAKGGNIMLGGIVVQLVAITIYVTLATEVLVRFYTKRPLRQPNHSEEGDERPSLDRKVQLMIFGLSFSTICIFIRSVYRTIELSDGWSGRIIHTQKYFNILDGAMIVLAMYTLNFLHPGILLRHIPDGPKKVLKTHSEESSLNRKSQEA
ncbi:RTA1 like protein [Schizopora paradoxa]|uniref:RTA1 like protein n=1 Tax=Schizopora paradoxa TaxID=27342 RepID=A0A0H2RZH4_9AGAM|nr:RTA1 like protein [Schizopora paradoxa]